MASTSGLPDRPLALVTGGSSGIGLELARKFATHGFDLVIGGSSDRVDDAASSLRQTGATVVPVRSDLTRKGSVGVGRPEDHARCVPDGEAGTGTRWPLTDNRRWQLTCDAPVSEA